MKKAAARSRDDRAVINDDIRDQMVRLVGADGSQVGIVSREDALAQAQRDRLDLVLIAPDASPPVCKIMDYGKHLFDIKKQKAAQRKKQRQTQVKEMKLRPGTEEGDYQVKLKALRKFLEEGDKTKVSLRFRGREMLHPELGRKQLSRIAHDLEELASVESEPKMEGRQMIMVLAPNKNRKRARPSRRQDTDQVSDEQGSSDSAAADSNSETQPEAAVAES